MKKTDKKKAAAEKYSKGAVKKSIKSLGEKKEALSEDKNPSKTIGKNRSFAMEEAHKRLRTNIMFSFADDSECHVIGVTSSIAHEGKSTTSINLAYDLTKAGKRTLLIDADMRLSCIAMNLEIHRSPGLSNILVGNDNGENIVQRSPVQDHLPVISCGDIPPNPSELIMSDKMKALIEQLREAYDYVIVDLPPVNRVSDPIMMSRHLDGMIVIVRHGYTRRRDVNDAVRSLNLVNAKILGFVYNGAKTAKKRYRKSNYYQYNYYTSSKG